MFMQIDDMFFNIPDPKVEDKKEPEKKVKTDTKPTPLHEGIQIVFHTLKDHYEKKKA